MATSESKTTVASPRLPVVGIGASAGGLESSTELLKALPSHTGMSFVLVTHLEPSHQSELADILSRVTPLSVVEAKDGSRVEADHVYVIPPNRAIEITGGVLKLFPRSESESPHYPIDRFFKSLAADQGSQAIAGSEKAVPKLPLTLGKPCALILRVRTMRCL